MGYPQDLVTSRRIDCGWVHEGYLPFRGETHQRSSVATLKNSLSFLHLKHVLLEVIPAFLEIFMQTPILSAHEVAVIAQAIDVHVAERADKRILGAKLGSIISEAIRPKHLRELGGMRNVANTALTSLLTPVPQRPEDSDAIFEVKSRTEQALTTTQIPDSPTEVAGAALWRFFSNPRLACALTISPTGTVQVQRIGAEFPIPTSTLNRPTTADYQQLAQVFAGQEVEPTRSDLLSVMDEDDFYNTWIARLRSLRTPQNNLLKRWETLRSQFVATELYRALTDAGLDAVRASETVSTARPVAGLRQPRPQSPVELKGDIPTQNLDLSQPKPALVTDELTALRSILHDAINRMSFAELRELRIPAGALVDTATR